MMSFYLSGPFSHIVHFWGYGICFLIQSKISLSLSNRLNFSVTVRFYKILVFYQVFFPNYQNAYGDQTCQGNEIPREASTHKFAWHTNEVVLWGHVTNRIHFSTCRRTTENKPGKLMTYCDKLAALKPHDTVITWSAWGHLTNWKIYISTFTKLGRVLSSGRRFSTKTLELSPASCCKVYIQLIKLLNYAFSSNSYSWASNNNVKEPKDFKTEWRV